MSRFSVGSWLERLRSGSRLLTGFFGRKSREQRLDQEIQFHLDMETDRQSQAGLGPAEARRAARIGFGGEARFRADAADEIRSRTIEELAQDLRHGARTLRRTPGFTIVAILTLALGIGATTVFYSIADHVVLRPLPYPDSDRLVVIRETIEELSDQFPSLAANASHFLEWRQSCSACGEIAAVRVAPLTLTGFGDPEQIGSARVSANLFPLLGARAALGRLFTSEEDQGGGPRTVILSDGFWRRLGADPALVGRAIMLGDVPWTVVGILSREFRFPTRRELGIVARVDAEVFTPLALTPHEMTTPGEYDYGVIARLAPGATFAELQGQLDRVARDFTQRSGSQVTIGAHALSLHQQMIGSARGPLMLLLGAVAAVLLIVCVNLGNLLLARNLGRAREWAVRVAVGGRRDRLVRQTLTESGLIAVLGGALGILLSSSGLDALLRLAPADLPRASEITLDIRVMAVSMALSILVGLGFGAVPALHSSRTDPADALKAGTRTTAARPASRLGRRLLIGGQVALSALLLCVTGLLVASFVRVSQVDKGFVVSPILALDLSLPLTKYSTAAYRMALFDDLTTRLASAPGVVGVAVTTGLPLEGDTQVDMLGAENDSRREGERPVANIRYVSPSYFATIGTPLRKGRSFEDGDRTRPVVILSERAAAALWPGENPIGKRMVPGSNDPVSEVVGIVADIRTSKLEKEGSLVAYLPHWSRPPVIATLLVKASREPEALTAIIRAELRALAPSVPITRVRTVPEIMSVATAGRRFQLLVLIAFAATALVTVAVGIYGIVAHSLARRGSEIGLRLALGARRSDVHRQILGQELAPVAAGLTVGILSAIALGRSLSGLLYQVRPADPVTLVAVATVVLGVAAVACWIPARRATAEGALRGLRLE